MADTEKTLILAVNPELIDKNVTGDTALYTTGFVNVAITPDEFAREILRGTAYCAQLNGSRRTSHFRACNVASVDVDHGMTVEEALAHPFVRAHALLLYTTVSHTPEAHRFRVVFPLPKVITSAKAMRRVTVGLTRMLGGDRSATDPARIFFGNHNAEIHRINGEMTAELVAEVSADAALRDGHDVKGREIKSRRSLIEIAFDQVLRLADGPEMSLQDVPILAPVHCPVHDDARASAFVVESRQGVRGVHCCACNKTYWPAEGLQDTYEFGDFIGTARDVNERQMQMPVPGAPETWSEGVKGKPAGARLDIVHGYPTPERLRPGVTCVVSPKGTGKTEGVKRLAARADKVLLIGHRRSLIRSSCRRLDLNCYLDRPKRKADGSIDDKRPFNRDRYGICLDSLEQIPPDSRPDVLIIDESEQVLTHLVSETIAGKGNAYRIFTLLRHLVGQAKHIVALDADLGWLTFETLSRMNADPWRSKGTPPLWWRRKQVYLHINDVVPPGQKHVEVFASKNHLIGDLMQAIEAGKRCFVASNTKSLVDKLAAAIRHQYGDTRRVIAITADTVTRAEVQDFIGNAAERAATYDVILCSPSLGTGVDITFPDNAELVDCVYGFFEHSITTHFDIDQQLHRVRHPGAMRVWVNRRTFRYETHPDVVESDLLRAGMYRDLLEGYEDDGTPRYKRGDPLIAMAALVVAGRRASMNDLHGNFIRHKQTQGCTIAYIGKDLERSVDGYTTEQRGRHLSEDALIASIMGATVLPRPEYDRVREAIEAGAVVPEAQYWCYQRTRVELFYRAPATPELIRLDDRGRQRERVHRFAAVSRSGSTGTSSDVMEPLDGNLRFLTQPDRDVPLVLRRLLRLTPVWTPTLPDGASTPPGGVATTFDAEVVFDACDLAAFGEFLLANKGAIENVLKLPIRQMSCASRPNSSASS